MRKAALFGVFVLVGALMPGRLAAQTPASVTCPTGLTAGGASGTYTVVLTGAAPAGLTGTPDSSNTAVATVPASVAIPTGATTFTFQVTPVAAGIADVGIRVNGTRLDCGMTVAAAIGPPPATGAPTLSTLGMVITAALLALAGFIVARRI